MERSLYGFILRYSRRDQLLIVPFVVLSMLFYYATLDLPKTIINQPIQGKGFPQPDSTQDFLRFAIDWPGFLGGGRTVLFEGFALERTGYLFALTLSFLGLIILGGLLKYQINTMKGWMGERMLRRLRFALFDHLLRFPLPHFRRVKSAEMATMINNEVEPLGGFVGESIITPLFLGGQALTALFFILFQHVYLGMVAFGMVVVQAVIIPRMRRRLLELSRQRQIAARQLAGRIAECVDGVVEIHAHDTSNYERAELSARLGRLFLIRFEHFQRKFLIKFLNNLLSQITPFLFYLVGGYLAISGRLDIGALVAVIAAYKDLPGPVKELIDWDQERLDANIKYNQVVEQFTIDNLAAPSMQEPVAQPLLPREGEVKVGNVSLADESGTKLVNSVSLEFPLKAHVAFLGGNGSGASELAQIVARLLVPDAGFVLMGGIDVTRASEAVTGRAIGYVGPSAYLFPLSVRDNLLYGLKHRPVADAAYAGAALRQWEARRTEAARAGNTTLDFGADWIDYGAAGCNGATDLDARLLDVARTVELEETLFEIGLRSAVPAGQYSSLPDLVLQARALMRSRLADLELSELVEHFDAALYNRNASLAENLLFGTPVGKVFDIENLAQNPYVRSVLDETGLSDDLLSVGYKLAETMLELFSDLPPGHELFERFSFIAYDDLPQVKEIVAQAAASGLDSLSGRDRSRLLGLPFKLIVTKHRLGLIDEGLEARVLDARRRFAAGLPPEMWEAVEFFDSARFNSAASLQDNILFGKIASGQAGGAVKIGRLLREILDELDMRPQLLLIGMDFQVGTGGARLSMADRQKVAIGRALIKRPALLVLDQATAVMDPKVQDRLAINILACRAGSGVLWVLNQVNPALDFEVAVVMDKGQIVESGAPAQLMAQQGAYFRLRKGSDAREGTT